MGKKETVEQDRTNKDNGEKGTLNPANEQRTDNLTETKEPKNKPVVNEEEEETEETTIHEAKSNNGQDKNGENEEEGENEDAGEQDTDDAEGENKEVRSGEDRELDELEEELNGAEKNKITNKDEHIVNKK
jgi:hypothetical protein